MTRRNHSFIDSNVCKCGAAFRYYRVTRPKIYCRPCRAREKRENAKFFSALYYSQKKEALA